jgi:hypothetical protein
LTTPISGFGQRRRPSTGYNSLSSKPLAERLFSRHEPADLVEKCEEEEVGDKPRSSTLNGTKRPSSHFPVLRRHLQKLLPLSRLISDVSLTGCKFNIAMCKADLIVSIYLPST